MWCGRQHRTWAPTGSPVGPPAVLPRAAPAADTGSRSIRRRHPRSPSRSVELLQALAPAVPDEMTVVVLCDRGLASPKLWQQIRAQSLPRRRPGAGIRFRFLLRGSPLSPNPPMDGARIAEGGEEVTDATVRARIRVDWRLAGGLSALLGVLIAACDGCGERDGGIGHGKKHSRTGPGASWRGS